MLQIVAGRNKQMNKIKESAFQKKTLKYKEKTNTEGCKPIIKNVKYISNKEGTNEETCDLSCSKVQELSQGMLYHLGSLVWTLV